MAKTKPIGVRFDKEMLSDMKEKKIAETPQKALNHLTNIYNGNISEPKEIKIQDATKPTNVVKPITEKPPTTNYTINTLTEKEATPEPKEIPPMPKKEDYKDSIEFGMAKSEWKKLWG